ncbi:hypothetical protein [Schlesneria sp. DSM 10557]|uniref:hypothetical protein n=1 Tax=Schlesneria sp. DSM 10557 TaxID=3044399 RepID=UPI0035A0DAD5
MKISEETRQLAKRTIVQREGETFDSYYSRYTEFVISQMLPDSGASSTGAMVSAATADLDAAMLKAPNFFVKGWNFGKHMAWAAWHRFPQADEKTIQQRLSICEACEHRENEHCKLCGCKCELKNHLMNKLAHAGSVCPIGKWKAVEGKRTKKGSKK